MEDFVYDLETYPQIFTATFVRVSDGAYWQYVISDWESHLDQLLDFLNYLRTSGGRLVGYNNIGFDYPILHMIMMEGPAGLTSHHIADKAQAIINAMKMGDKFSHTVWPNDWLIPQIDLFKIHHFDNVARSTGLKVLEFNMGSDNIEDLPFDLDAELYPEDTHTMLHYNLHDCVETMKFLEETRDMIEFREELTARYGKDFTNFNDTKIGKEYFIMRLEEANPGCCYYRDEYNKRQIRQTPRDQVALGELVFPYISFRHPEFNRILGWFRQQVVTETKGSIKDVSCNIDGFTYHFGTGGLHGSIESALVASDDKHVVIDLDVTSYYPSIPIANRIYPAHLGELFCDIYADIKAERKKHVKGTPINAMLKLALNGVYGDSNNQYSPFYDPAYMLAVTINGQLMLCMLAEMLTESVPGLEMIQANTDGVTVRIPRNQYDALNYGKDMWQMLTGLELEEAVYSRMWIRDVNNYVAESADDGTLKRKGAYQIREDLGWHQNFSMMIVPMAAQAALVHGVDHEQYILNHQDIRDFMLRAKVQRSHALEWGDEKVPNICRYYVSTAGRPLEKVMPPAGPIGQYKRANGLTDQFYYSVLKEIQPGTWDVRIHTKNKSKYEERRTGINTGRTVQVCNDLKKHASFDDIDYQFYIDEAWKLIKPFRG